MRSRRHLVIENLALRQQLVTLAGRRYPDIRPVDRVFWILLRRVLCLGFDVSERSVSRYLRSLPRTPRANPTWTTFLRNHRDGIAAMDFFTAPIAMFRVLHVFLVIRHGRRDVPRRQPPTGRRPAPPLRLAPGRVSRFGPEVHLDLAAGSIGGRGSCDSRPMAPSIHPSGATIEAPFPASGALLHPTSHGVLFANLVLGTYTRTIQEILTPRIALLRRDPRTMKRTFGAEVRAPQRGHPC
jgi:hypothetical protein